MTIPSDPVLIIGAGMGGLTAAIALRAAGFPVLVLERAPELREAGAAISIMANAAGVLKHYGLLDALLRHGEPITAGVIQPNDGGPLMPPIEIRTKVPGVLLHRADLQEVLLSAVPPELVILGETFEEFREDETGVTARFLSGWEVRGSLLIGADGLRSAVRARLLNDGPPVYRGYQCWRGVNPVGRVANPAEILGRGVRVGLIPMGRRGAAWWLCANEPETTAEEPGERKEKLLGLLSGWHDSVRDLIAGTPDGDIFKNAIYDRVLRCGWSRGRALLLGDAAHPTTPNLGQGGGMAIEDAAVLARCLAHFPEHGEAFRRFEEIRFERVKKIVNRSRMWGRMGQWSHPLACRLRNFLLKATPRSGLTKDLLEVMDYDPFAEKL